MSGTVIAEFARTPFHFAKKGKLIESRPDDLVALVLKSIVERSGINPTDIEDVLVGCAFPEGEQGNNVARLALLLAGLPQSIAGATINRFCGSSMAAIHYAAGQIAIGAGEAFICAGVESNSRVPQGGFSFAPNPRFKSQFNPNGELNIEAYISMGETAENVADRYHISRVDQEQFAMESHQRAASAQSSGHLRTEIVPVMTAEGLIEQDGCLRPATNLEGLAALKPVFRENGSVTAGTSSPLTDGAAGVLVCSEDFAQRNKLDILARIRSVAVAGCAPEIMGMGPVPATQKALARAGLTVDDIDIFEINEAFASQCVACLRELKIPREKVNIDGGGIALGHPLGATGARITGKAAQILKREGKRFALATQCIGGGQGIATVLESI
jgi:acetyl-CoA acyltransferase